MKKKNVASMAMAAMMAAGALPMNAWAAPEVNHDEPLTIEVYEATPAGLKAMEALAELEKERGKKAFSDGTVKKGERTASNEMCDFLIINISSLQIIPVNIIAYRSQYGSVNPAQIVGPALIATTCSTLTAIIFCKIRQNIYKI